MFLGDTNEDRVNFLLHALHRYSGAHAGETAHEVPAAVFRVAGPGCPHVARLEWIAEAGRRYTDHRVRIIEIETPSDDVRIPTEQGPSRWL